MKRKTKIVAFTALWALYGGLVWLIAEYTQPAKAAAILAVTGSAMYFVLLTILFFGRRTP